MKKPVVATGFFVFNAELGGQFMVSSIAMSANGLAQAEVFAPAKGQENALPFSGLQYVGRRYRPAAAQKETGPVENEIQW